MMQLPQAEEMGRGVVYKYHRTALPYDDIVSSWTRCIIYYNFDPPATFFSSIQLLQEMLWSISALSLVFMDDIYIYIYIITGEYITYNRDALVAPCVAKAPNICPSDLCSVTVANRSIDESGGHGHIL